MIAARFHSRHALLPLVAGLVLALGACAEIELAAYTAKKIAPPPRAEGGAYKIGKPYQVDGVWYYPAADPAYDEVGIASWYGPEFHGKRTANGALFDMNALTAAHRTLPMPSLVRVTNLENGRSLVLTVNDRGPFARGRIIDVSRRAAQLLGFYEKGTARVRVQAVSVGPPGSEPALRVASADSRAAPANATEGPRIKAAPVAPVSQAPLQPPPGPAVASRSLGPGDLARTPREFYVQAGAFGDLGNAKRLSAALASFGRVRMMRVFVDGRPIYRVQVGPVATMRDADGLLARIVAAGYRDSHVIVE